MVKIDFTAREGRRVQGRLIQQAAEEAGLSLEALAREIGCSRALIYQYVSGAILAQPDRIQLIAERTGKSLLYFYGGEDAPAHLQERIRTLQQLLQAQLAPPDIQGARSTCEQVIVLACQSGDVRMEAGARLHLAAIHMQSGDYDRTLQILDQAEASLRRPELESLQARGNQQRGHALLMLGRVEEAEACFLRAAAGDDWQVRWQGMVSLAAVAEHRGQYFTALERLDRALGLAESAPSARAAQLLRLYVTGNIANVHLACGDHLAAAEKAEEASELAVQLANRDQYIESLLTRGVCLRLRGELPQSRLLLESAIRWAQISEDKGRLALARAELAQTLVEAGRFADARLLGREALQLAASIGTRRAEFAGQLAMASAYLRDELPLDARYHATRAWELSTHLGQPHAQATALSMLGETHAALDEPQEAEKAFRLAIDLADAIGARIPAIQAALVLSRLTGQPRQESLPVRTRELAVPALHWSAQLLAGQYAENAGELTRAQACYQEAVTVITGLRRSLETEPTGDTYLEYSLAWQPYVRLAQLYRQQGETDASKAIVLQCEWPPLESLLEEVA